MRTKLRRIGLNGRLEMDRWSAAGVTPSQLLRAATVSAAEFFGLQQEIGTIDVGKRADLLLMRSNPLETVAAFDEIDLVFVAGRPLARHELSASREQAR